ncbi:LacI family transcriptional regulator [Bifidobacterium sp. UTCIF-37]|uniref:LacI family DNA-binding transcriptional regulator n=1 Tax=unclassified Bifidobacterium TaxID=2608897 RepID=UPI00112924DC|nr:MULTISPECIES: LacI family DNA-binding transcriptional regulator [unclassified Bifidobacterium]TPF85478.1 LacI family transcriptional regulator [Bifidobacterium sp. UTCIF-37]TPF88948.1 LacI family transcriptional regulator [Bifidobacterium sp. UTCIF-38]
MSSTSSITNVAALARVSKATVSRVLSGQRTKDDDIARRVRDAAEKLNYSANSAASALRSDTTNTIGLVMPDPSSPIASRMLAELDPISNGDNKQLLIGIGDDLSTQEERVSAMLMRRIDGLILIPPKDTNPTFLDAHAGNVPIVQVSGRSSSFLVNWVGVDENASMNLTMHHLADHNATSIAYLSGNIDSPESADLFTTFQITLSAMNLMSDPDWTTFGECTTERGYREAMELFESKGSKPDAVICASDEIAVGVLMALFQLGISVPHDVIVIGSGDSPIANAISPTLTSLRPPCRLLAKETMRLLGKENDKQHWMPARVAFPPQLVRRESTDSPRFGSSDMTTPRSDDE